MRKHTGMHITLIICCAIAFSSQSVAIVSGGSNLGLSGYPEHSCGEKPMEPPVESYMRDPLMRDPQWEIEINDMQREGYDALLSIYIDCINEYVNNANNDIKRIREAISAASDEASS